MLCCNLFSYLSPWLSCEFLKRRAKTALLSLVLNKVTSIQQELHNYCWIIKWIFNSSKNRNRKKNRTENGRANMGWLTVWKKERRKLKLRRKQKNKMQKRYDATLSLLFFCGVGLWRVRHARSSINNQQSYHSITNDIHLWRCTLIIKPVHKQAFCNW